jgi:hypothetical protein
MSKMKRSVNTDWRQLCQLALLETDPVKTRERVAAARSAVLDRVEDCLAKSVDGEQSALREALAALDVLRKTKDQNSHSKVA